jgi:hypothetical protein
MRNGLFKDHTGDMKTRVIVLKSAELTTPVGHKVGIRAAMRHVWKLNNEMGVTTGDKRSTRYEFV